MSIVNLQSYQLCSSILQQISDQKHKEHTLISLNSTISIILGNRTAFKTLSKEDKKTYKTGKLKHSTIKMTWLINLSALLQNHSTNHQKIHPQQQQKKLHFLKHIKSSNYIKLMRDIKIDKKPMRL